MNIKDLVFSALMSALIAVMALFPPLTLFFSPVPVTLQSLGAMLAGSLLGAKRGAYALLIFLLMVAIGFPVLAGLVGGVGLFLTPSGGFMLSWPVAAWVIGWLTEKFWQRLNFIYLFLINVFGGIILVYLVGIPWMALFAKLSMIKAFYLALVYMPGDLVKAGLAAWIGMTFKKYNPYGQHFMFKY